MLQRLALCIILLALPGMSFAQQGLKLKGLVLSGTDDLPLEQANILISGTTIGAATGADGRFLIPGLPAGQYEIVVSYIGYSAARLQISLPQKQEVTVRLSQNILDGARVTVTATHARERVSPVAFSSLSREELAARHTLEDIPELLAELPSATFNSESGAGLGYNYLSIRGFDQRRISVLVNGIPQNDPEDHNVYWVNFPDMAANVQSIQVQRGAGSAFYGPPAIGGSINIQTNTFSPDRQLRASFGYGSFNTRKSSLSYNSGLLNDRIVLFGRASNIKTDGYRDRTWVDFWSFFGGAAYYTPKSSTRIHVYGGPIKDGLAYSGLPRFYNEDAQLRRRNLSYFELNATADSVVFASDRRSQEEENFNQPHFELLHDLQISENLLLRNSAFFIRGYGHFDFDGSWGWPDYFRLTPEFNYNVTEIPGDALIRAFVDNRQGGWLPNLTWQHNRGELTAGAELRMHRSLHWGRLQQGSGLPADVVGDDARRYYSYRGGKNIASAYVHENFRLQPDLYLSADLQYVYKNYRLYEEAFIGNEFDVPYHFLNPRLGINYNASSEVNFYASISRTGREPRLANLYDAAESSSGALPQFVSGADGNPDFDSPTVNPEYLNDIEVGLGYRSSRLSGSANLYFMDFQDEIIKDGGKDRFGQPTTGNAERTRHAGLELSGQLQITPQLSLSGNALLSQNELINYSIFAGDGSEIVLDGNRIAGFPNQLANLRLIYAWQKLYASLLVKYVGRQYTDNFQTEANSIAPYGVLNFNLKYDLPAYGLVLRARIQNLLDKKYIAWGNSAEFFPAAGRNGFLALEYAL